MNSTDFVSAVGAQYLNDAYGTSSGTSPTASTEYFNANYEAFSGGIKPDAPAADRSYDAGAIVALAVAKAGKGDAAAIKAAIPDVVAADGEPIHAGKDEFVKALALIKEGKKLRYEGVIGPISFDQYGDITGPFRLWRIKDGEVTTVGPLLYAGVENRLHFAGEHTCYKFVGYMEGALNSGASIARRLAVRDGVTVDRR